MSTTQSNIKLEGSKPVWPCQLLSFSQWNQSTVFIQKTRFASTHVRSSTLRATKSPSKTKANQTHQSRAAERPSSAQKAFNLMNVDPAAVKTTNHADPSISKTAAPSSSHTPSSLAEPVLGASSNPSKSSSLSPTALNAFAVSQLSARAHPSRPAPQINDGRLPDKYKPAARRITAIMVALPILIVTSCFLWGRLVLGHEQKRFVRAPPGRSGAEGMGQKVPGAADVVGDR